MPRTLLLADDSITIQKVVAITFAAEDFDVVAVDNGEEALARVRELRPAVVLADVVMPRRNGYELCQAIKSDAELRNIPVLLLSGSFEPIDPAKAAAVRADGYLLKPFDSQVLIDKVAELSGGGPAQSAAAPGYASAPSPPSPLAPASAPKTGGNGWVPGAIPSPVSRPGAPQRPVPFTPIVPARPMPLSASGAAANPPASGASPLPLTVAANPSVPLPLRPPAPTSVSARPSALGAPSQRAPFPAAGAPAPALQQGGPQASMPPQGSPPIGTAQPGAGGPRTPLPLGAFAPAPANAPAAFARPPTGAAPPTPFTAPAASAPAPAWGTTAPARPAATPASGPLQLTPSPPAPRPGISSGTGAPAPWPLPAPQPALPAPARPDPFGLSALEPGRPAREATGRPSPAPPSNLAQMAEAAAAATVQTTLGEFDLPLDDDFAPPAGSGAEPEMESLLEPLPDEGEFGSAEPLQLSRQGSFKPSPAASEASFADGAFTASQQNRASERAGEQRTRSESSESSEPRALGLSRPSEGFELGSSQDFDVGISSDGFTSGPLADLSQTEAMSSEGGIDFDGGNDEPLELAAPHEFIGGPASPTPLRPTAAPARPSPFAGPNGPTPLRPSAPLPLPLSAAKSPPGAAAGIKTPPRQGPVGSPDVSAPTSPGSAGTWPPAAPLSGASRGAEGEAALRLALSQASREVIERIVWEVVPQLAETIVREHVERLAQLRPAK